MVHVRMPLTRVGKRRDVLNNDVERILVVARKDILRVKLMVMSRP